VEQGSLYPALYRLVDQGWIRFRMGNFREQPQGPILPAHRRGKKETPRGEGQLAALVIGN